MRYCILLLLSLCISALAVWCGINDNITPKEHSTLTEKVDINLQLLSDDQLDSNFNISQRHQAFLESEQLQHSLFEQQGKRNVEEYAKLSTHKLATLQEYVQLSLATNTTTLLQNFATRSAFGDIAKNRLLRSNKNLLINTKLNRSNENEHKTSRVQQLQATQGKYVVIHITESHLNKMTSLQHGEYELHKESASQVLNGKATQGLFNSVAVMLQQMQKSTHHMVRDEDVHVLDDQHYLVYITPSPSTSASALSLQEREATTNRTTTTYSFSTTDEQESNHNISLLQPDINSQVENVSQQTVVEEEHVHHRFHPIHVLDVFSSSSTSLLKLSVRLRSYLHTRLTFSDFVLYSNKCKNNKLENSVNSTEFRDNIESDVLEAEKQEKETQFINFTIVPESKLLHRYVKEESESNSEMLELMVMTAHGMASEVVETLRRSLQKFTQSKEHSYVTEPSRLEEYKNCNVIFYTQQEMRKGAHAESSLRDDYFIFRIMLDTSSDTTNSNNDNSGVKKYKCLGLVTPIAVHPAIRWIEHSARSPFVLNEIAASGIQGGYVARNNTNTLSSSSPANDTNWEFRECLNNKYITNKITNTCKDINICNNSEVVINNNYHATNLHPLWSMGINGSNEIILISDSGVDYRSCYFADDQEEISLYPKISHTHRKIISYHGCARDGDDKPSIGDQVNGHGTHVAGSALGATFYQSQLNTETDLFDVNEKVNDTSYPSFASPSSFCAQNYIASGDKKHSINTQNSFLSSDMSRYNGVAFAAKMFMEHMTCGGEKAGYVTIPGVLEDLYYPGYYAGARVGCNSWGFYPDMSYSALEKIIDRIVYDHDDLLLLFASGNNANWGTHIPGTAKNVLTVGSHVNSASATEQNVIASTSSWGKVYDLRIKPELVGPGGLSVNSARSSGRKELYNQNENVNCKSIVYDVQNSSVCGRNTFYQPILLDEQVGKTMNKSEKYVSCNDKDNTDSVFSIPEDHEHEQQQQYEQDDHKDHKHEYKQTVENETRLISDSECSVVRKTGTSMANGVTTGAAALIRQYLREWHHIASPSASLLKATLIHSTVYLAKEVKRAGFGRVDLSLLPATPIEWVKEVHVQSMNNDHTEKNNTFMENNNKVITQKQIVHLQNWLADREVVTHHSYKEYYFTATSLFDDNSTKFTQNWNLQESEQQEKQELPQIYKETNEANIKDSPVIDIRQEARLLKVTLVWTDIAAAVEGTTKSLINDLDLMVVDVWGHMYYGNAHMSEASKKDGKFDRTNNVEQIRLELSANLAQEFRVIVYGNKVITNIGQQYSLVVSAPGLHYVKTVSPHVQHNSQLSEKEIYRQHNNNNYSDNNNNIITNDKKKNEKDDTIQSVSRYCANNCSHHGTCDAASLTCTCSTQYRFVDCSLCNEEVVCSGHGSCDDKTLKCTCDPNSHFVDQLSYLTSHYSTAEDIIAKHLNKDDDNEETKSMESTAACSVCQTGWYGPWCNSRCECQNGGICNTTTGECMCVQNKQKNLSFYISPSVESTRPLTTPEKLESNTEKVLEQEELDYNKVGILINEKFQKNDNSTQTLAPVHHSCFDGDSCQYCCPGYGGEQCDEVSYWCDTSGNLVNITQDYYGWIEINSYHTYPRSMRCNWRLTAPRFHRIVLEIVEVKLEYGFDTISVYDVKRNRANHNYAANHLVGYNEPTELVRRYTGELWHIPPYTSKSNTLALQFVSDWGPVNEGFKIHYSFVEEPQCNITCSLPKTQQSMWPLHLEQMTNVSTEHHALIHNEHLLVESWNETVKEQIWSGAEEMSEVMTCGSVLELPTWCICVPPYFGINCRLRSDESAKTNAIIELVKKDSNNNRINEVTNMTSSVNTTNVNTLQNKASMHHTNMVSDEDNEINLSTLQIPVISWAVAESTLHVPYTNITHKPTLYTRLWLTINGLSVLHVMYDMVCTTPERMNEPHILELTFDMQVDKLMHKKYKLNGTLTKLMNRNENTVAEVSTEHHAIMQNKFINNSNAMMHDVMESLVLSISRVVVAEEEMWQSTFAHTQLLPLSTSFAQERESSSSSSSSRVRSCSLNSETGQVIVNVEMPVRRAMECHNNSTNHNDGDGDDDADKEHDASYDATFALMLLWNASRKVSFSSELLSMVETEGIDMLVGARMKDNDKADDVILSSTTRSRIDKEEPKEELKESQNEEEEEWYDEYDFNLTCVEDIGTNDSNGDVAQICVGQSEQVPEWELHNRNNSHHNNMRNRHVTNVTKKIAVLCVILSGVLGLLLGQLMAISLQRGWWTRIKCVCCGQAESNVYDTVEVTWHSEDVLMNNNINSGRNEYVSSLHADTRSMREYDSYLQRVFSNDGSNESNKVATTTTTAKHSNTTLGRGNDEADEGIEMELVASTKANNGEVQKALNKNSATGAVENE